MISFISHFAKSSTMKVDDEYEFQSTISQKAKCSVRMFVLVYVHVHVRVWVWIYETKSYKIIVRKI